MCLSALTPRDRSDKISRHLPYSWLSNCLMAHRANPCTVRRSPLNLCDFLDKETFAALRLFLRILLRELIMAAPFFHHLALRELTMVLQLVDKTSGRRAEEMELASQRDCCGTVGRPKD